MSTGQGLHAPASAPKAGSPDDPFRYGWRYAKITRPAGTEDYDQVPLTLEDLLFPQESDLQVQTDMHDEDCLYLKTVLRARLANDPAAIVPSDCRIDFNVEGLRPLGPDVAVLPLGPDVAVLSGHNGPRRDWATFHVGAERSRPVLTVEVTSPDTRKNDVGIKLGFYQLARVPFYLIVDVRPRGDRRILKLAGYRWTPDGYEKIAPDAEGRLSLPQLNVSLGKRAIEFGERVACFDPETGEEIGESEQITADLKRAEAEAADARAAAEAARAEAAEEMQKRIDLEARLKSMEAMLRQPPPSTNGSH